MLKGLLVCLCLMGSTCAAEIPLDGKFVPLQSVETLLSKAALQYQAPRAAQPVVLDGKIDAWKEMPALVLDRKDTVPASSKIENAADLSGKMRIQWDEKALYFCLEVTDNVFSAPYADENVWQNDCCQIAFDALRNGPAGGYDSEDLAFVISQTPNGPVVLQSHERGNLDDVSKPVAGAQVKIVPQEGGGCLYQFALPWSALRPITPAILGSVGFNFSINDNDGKGFKGALQWTKGLVYGKDASKFGELVFDQALHGASAVLELPAEERPSTPTEGSLLKLAGVDPYDRATAVVFAKAAGEVEVAVRVYPFGGTEPVATGRVKQNLEAGALGAFTWDLAALPMGKYQIEYVLPFGQGTSPKLLFCRFDLIRFRENAAKLCEAFGLDKPGDALTDATPLVRRHRGLVAVANAWAADKTPLDKNPVTKLDTQIYLAQALEALAKGEDFLATRRGPVLAAYYCMADDSGEPFVIHVPKTYDPAKKYPLFVWLHGSGGRPVPVANFMDSEAYLYLETWGRGDAGYLGIAEHDTFEALEAVKSWYSIDPNRIYLGGSSMGGRGTWHTIARHADEFAAALPVCGTNIGLYLENLNNLPIFNQHGTADWAVRIDYSRIGVEQLLSWGYPVLHKEYPGMGHMVPEMAPAHAWALTQRRNPNPETVVLTADHPDEARAFWARVRVFADPHQPAKVRARAWGRGPQQTLSVGLENVDALELDRAQMPLDAGEALRVQIGTAFSELKGPLPEKIFLIRKGEAYEIANHWEPPATEVRPYAPGAAANLTIREPLLFVYGTKGDAERTAMLRNSAALLAVQRLATGGYPVKADKDVSEEDLKRCNLLIFGGPRDNQIAELIFEKLPLKIDAENRMSAGPRNPIKLDRAGYTLNYFNPLAPVRLVCLMACDMPTAEANTWYVRSNLPGFAGDATGDLPDLLVAGLNGGGVRRRMHFTNDWKWADVPGAQVALPADRASIAELSAATVAVIRATANADFALLDAQKEDGLFADPESFTLADMATDRAPGQLALTRMSGKELAELAPLVASKELFVCPELDVKTLDPERLYRVAMPPISARNAVARQERNLREIFPGPDWRKEDLWLRLFGEKAREAFKR